ncbi:MAG: alpha/beta hydrolase, partial [Eubacteriales bacterium]|nr:alpha/beta hydrolase [Eubacteriales bacterium]
MKVLKYITIIISVLILIIILFILVSYVNHKFQLSKEDKLFIPNGEMVEVNGHNIHVYTEGEGDEVLVFLSGGGTSSPVLDFKSLYSLLSDSYKIAV